MSEKFDGVPVDEDTKTLFRLEAKLGEFDILYEKWTFEGVTAESFIFTNEDVSGMTNEEIEQEVRKSPLVKEESEVLIKRLDAGFAFANFNFET